MTSLAEVADAVPVQLSTLGMPRRQYIATVHTHNVRTVQVDLSTLL